MTNDDVDCSASKAIRLENIHLTGEIQNTSGVVTSPDSSFTEVSLGEKRKKAPKRILHFSDGILEEYSTDEECDTEDDKQPLIDPKTLTWIPYIWYIAWWLGSRTLAVCDFLGEHLAYFFGITAPKYQYEIEEHKRLVEEEENERKKTVEETAGWQGDSNLNEIQVQEPGKAASEEEDEKHPFTTQQEDTSQNNLQNWERY